MLSDTIHERMKGWFARILLGLIIISFALFGVDAYFRGTGGGQWVAEVDGQKISALEFDEALKQEQARLRQQGERDAARLESPELKKRVLDELVRQRVLATAALARGYEVPEEALLAQLAAEPAFQEDGRFSEARLAAFLAQRRLSRAQLLQLMRQDALINQLLSVPVAAAIVPKTTEQRFAAVLAETREVSRARLSFDAYSARVKVAEADIEAYYQAHPEMATVPEQVRVEYLVFSPETLLPTIELGEADLVAYYQAHAAEFAEPERREAAHILLRLRPDAPAATREAVEKKAAELFAQAQKAPEKFAELARQFSEDPATASRGGDLGPVVPGALFPEVDRVLFGMAKGTVAGPVRSPAGLHILFLKSIEPARQKPFEQVKEQVREAARREAALRRFQEEAEKFGDLVYAQYGSLKPAAEQYKLEIQTSGWIARGGRASYPFDNERLLAAVFSDEAIKGQRNTEAIEVAPNTLVAARVVEHKPAGRRPLAEVRAEIERRLAREQAVKLAREAGAALLARLKQGEAVADLKFDAPRLLDRRGAPDWDGDALRAVFSAPATRLPAFAGRETPDGFEIYRISRVVTDPQRVEQAQRMAPALLQRAQASLLSQAYADSLRREAKVELRKELVEKAGER